MQYRTTFPRERRRSRRVEVPGSLLVIESRGPMSVVLRDLSARGLGLRTQREPQRGDVMRLMLALDGRGWLDLRGQVAYAQSRGGGVDVGLDLRLSDQASLDRLATAVMRCVERPAVVRPVAAPPIRATPPPPQPPRPPSQPPAARPKSELADLYRAALAEVQRKRTRSR